MGLEPSLDEMRRANVALGCFVHRWSLPLNPEDIDEIAYALLLHARTIRTDEEIVAAVQAQIDRHEEAARKLTEAMRVDAGRRGSAQPPE